MAASFGDMVTSIVNESRRSMSSDISNCILDAIAFYETERFFFNEFTQTFSLSSSQATYTSADASFIPQIMDVDTFRITVDSNYRPVLRKQQAEAFRHYDTTTFSQPTAWAYWSQSIIVDPAPDGGYAAEVAGVMRLTSLSASTDSNAWVERGNGYELIKRRAMALLYSTFLRDDANAQRNSQLEAQALDRLRARTTQLHQTGTIEPCL
jgi:hypothetical protein